MVDGGGSPGTETALRGLFRRAAVPSARSADPIRGLCFVAAGVDPGRVAGKPDFVLEERIGRGSLRAGIADRQAASRHAKLPWRDGDFSTARNAAGPAESHG